MKVLTTFAALDLLGPSYVWHTRALLQGELADGVLDGDLVLQGGGDPYLTLERWWSFAGRLRSAGLRAIKGDIVIDDTAYSLPAEDPAAFDGRPNRIYNVAPSALLVNFQSIDFLIQPDAGAGRVTISASPQPDNLGIDNRIRLVGGRCRSGASRVDFEVRTAAWDRVVFSGALAAGCAPREFTRALLRPADYAFGTFVGFWRRQGGEFSGRMRTAAAPAQARPLLSFDSLSLAELVRLTNKYSNNVMARALYLTLGSERFGVPATPDKSRDALQSWGRERGLDLGGAALDNGSGLSRDTRIPAATLARVLGLAYHSPWQPEFMASLPLGGIDGTLRSRLRGTPPGAVRLKTGHLAGVSAIAGYVTAADGRVCIVVSMLNDPRADTGAGDALQAALVQWVLGLNRTPATDAPVPTASR